MHIDIISCLPLLLESPLQHSILQRAQNKGILTVQVHDLRDYSLDKHRKVDDYPFGGGSGMVMTPQPIVDCIRYLQKQRSYDEIIYLTPDGTTLTQPVANRLSLMENIILLAGHYKGIDQRVRDYFITKEISIGDYVLSGGELAALVVVDAVARLLPGVLGDEQSGLTDSFQDGLLDPPVYTRPANFEGIEVPEILLSGHFAKIDTWRDEQALQKTKLKRPDLYQAYIASFEKKE